MRIPLLVGCVLGLCAGGCSPAWHSGNEGFLLSHSVRRAVVYGDSLSIQGELNRIVAVTDYGVKVNKVEDNSGKRLDFRSFQLFWMKPLCFELECSAPAPTAESVSVDLEFLTRSGRQRVRETVPILRNVKPNYATQLDRWRER